MYLSGCITLIQSVSGFLLIYPICNLDHWKSRQMIHAVQYMRKYVFRRSKRTIGDNSFYLLGKLQSACHQHSRTSHGSSVNQNLHVLSTGLAHPFDPHQSIVTILTAEADIMSFTLSMRSGIREKHRIAVMQVIIRKSYIVTHSLACISVKTDCHFFGIVVWNPGCMKHQSIIRFLINIFSRLSHEIFLFWLKFWKILTPVCAGHLHGALYFHIVPYHGSSIKICGASRL